MNRDKLRDILETLKSNGVLNGPIKNSGYTHFGISCLFAPWRHDKRKDSRASMTVKIDDEHASIFKCHACGFRSTLVEGLNELNVHLRGAITRLVQHARDTDGKKDISFTKVPGADHPVTTDYTAELRKLQEVPFPDKAAEFLKTKGCSVDIVRKMNCAWLERYEATKYDGETYVIEDAVLFPAVMRRDGELICVGAQAREVEGKSWMQKYLTILRFSSGFYLFGEHLLSHIRGRVLFIVEGPLDAMHILELGYPAVAVFGVFLSQARKEKIKRAGPERVIILPDPDSPGRDAAVKMDRMLNKFDIRSRIADTGKDPKTLTKNDIEIIIRRKHVRR